MAINNLFPLEISIDLSYAMIQNYQYCVFLGSMSLNLTSMITSNWVEHLIIKLDGDDDKAGQGKMS